MIKAANRNLANGRMYYDYKTKWDTISRLVFKWEHIDIPEFKIVTGICDDQKFDVVS